VAVWWIHEDTIPPLRRLQFQFTLNNGGDDVQFVKLVLEYWQLPDPNSETREADQIIISPRSTGITLWRGKNVPNKVALVTKGDEDLIEEGLIELVSNTSSQIRLYWTGVDLRLYGTMINLSQVLLHPTKEMHLYRITVQRAESSQMQIMPLCV
jgi:hypothetical protein